MAIITIDELHEHTFEWLHGAREHREIIVTDKGRPLVRIEPMAADEPVIKVNRFANRKLLSGFAALQARLTGGTDSTRIISEDRDGR
jgi:antitoxin (DNA-binding transcriptional repressor) of toxin-antitoxin stability system